MDDLKVITYQGHSFDQSGEAWYIFSEHRLSTKKQAGQSTSTKRDQGSRPHNKQQKEKKHMPQTVIGKFETPENGD